MVPEGWSREEPPRRGSLGPTWTMQETVIPLVGQPQMWPLGAHVVGSQFWDWAQGKKENGQGEISSVRFGPINEA